MKFFIDTADVQEIAAANELGLVDGVTTNPSLIAKSGRDFHEVLKEIIALVDGPISAEVVAIDAAGMAREGEELAKLSPEKIVIKLPITEEGLKATKLKLSTTSGSQKQELERLRAENIELQARIEGGDRSPMMVRGAAILAAGMFLQLILGSLVNWKASRRPTQRMRL